MRKTLVQLPAITVLAGCTLLNFDTGQRVEDVRSVRLPTGVTLLETDRAECAGAVQIDETNVADAGRSELVIQRGQNVAFEIEDDEEDITWMCVSRARSSRDSLECPRDTTHVRFIRASDDDLLLECYGDVDDRFSSRR